MVDSSVLPTVQQPSAAHDSTIGDEECCLVCQEKEIEEILRPLSTWLSRPGLLTSGFEEHLSKLATTLQVQKVVKFFSRGIKLKRLQ